MGMFSDDERPARAPESMGEALARRDDEQAGWSHPQNVLEREFVPAFPLPHPTNPAEANGGMDLRDWFAGLAMNSQLNAASDFKVAEDLAMAANNAEHSIEEHIAWSSYKIADAMMKARKQ